MTSTGHGANILTSSILGVFYLLRMAGDLRDNALTWVSPFGWGEKMQPYGSDTWWPLLLLLAVGAALITLSFRLEARRDHASGLLPDRPGPADGPAWLGTPLGLGLRLQRGALIGWTVALVASAVMFGSVIQAMTDLVNDSTAAASVMGGSGVSALVSMLVELIALVVAAFALQTTMTLRSDEASGILEPQLAGGLGRLRWMAGRLAIPIVGSLLLLAICGAFMGATYGASIHDGSQTLTLLGAGVAYWPAVLLLVGIAAALFGFAPRLATPVTWALLGVMWILTLVGDALNLPDWFMNAMPFAATPYQPMEPMDWGPLAVMTALAVVGFALGAYGFRRRDITPD